MEGVPLLKFVAVLAPPIQPCLGHFLDASAAFRRYRSGPGDSVEGDEPVIGLFGQSLQQPRHGGFAHSDDALIGRVLGHLLDIGAAGAVPLPLVGKPLEGFSRWSPLRLLGLLSPDYLLV